MNEYELRQALLNNLPKEPYLDTELRQKYVGCKTSFPKIEAAKFNIDSSYKKGLLFSHCFHKNRIKVVINVSFEMILQRIRVFENTAGHKTSINDCMIYEWSYIGAGSWFGEKQKIEALLDGILAKSKQPGPFFESGMDLIKRYFPEDDFCASSEDDLSFKLCCGAFKFWDDKDYNAAGHLVVELVKNVQEIKHPYVMTDLPFIAGRVGLCGECLIALRSLMESDVEISAEAWSNIGAVLCDALGRHSLALECFRHAIDIKPTLQPPRQAIWVAAHRLIEELLATQEYQRILDIGKVAAALGDFSLSHHGVWSFLGIASEMLGNKDDARKYYETAILRDPSCAISQQGLKRSKGGGSHAREILALIKRIVDNHSKSRRITEKHYT